TNDVPTSRDIARALERVLADRLNQTFHTRIAVGLSTGSRLVAAMNFGCSVIGTKSVRTGGNHVVPYNPTSGLIFDGFILNGFGYTAGVDHADPTYPISAPTMFVQGQGDALYQQHVTMAHELFRKGITLKGSVWIYEVKNLTHVTRDTSRETTQPS